ncbi:maleate cis-trans isomerase family protein [Denitrobaculum tricleocarpae]|uniref:Asp/Glu racemase n=1 Tax=Denitrobaculum tricleocarpae TaxID=2591009 RepID=A0A545TRC2_9PROT|nr:aspartate/glutamate racemase family protein [Denitrobaculum tricleocarpae]TQV79764.1 Asp/Glu racemase [Denitrobaculum tricleocarpae]
MTALEAAAAPDLPLTFETDAGIGYRAKLGLIVLETDQTIEPELRDLLGLEGVALYHSRIPSDREVTPETLARMEANLPAASRLLPAAAALDVVGYGCTSGTTIIGEEKVAQAVRAGLEANGGKRAGGTAVTNPLTAVKAALRALEAVRIGFITPYLPDVTDAMRRHLEQQGIVIMQMASFNQSEEEVVARITPASIRDAILSVGRGEDCDAVFVSCTNLRVLPVIAEAEAELGKAVISSNLALAWHMLRLAGIADSPPGRGRLFETTMTR